MAVVVRTHGGLGNQLFQIFYARLCASARGVGYAELHDTRYAHGFTRSTELHPAPLTATLFQRWISAMRLPKLALRAGLISGEAVTFAGNAYLDGYFQREGDYTAFDADAVRREIAHLRDELRVDPEQPAVGPCLYHVRLGDFFGDRQSALDHAIERVGTLARNSVVITNQEDIFADAVVARSMAEKGCALIGTDGFSAENVIRLMSGYAEIVTNDSTLALWASVLGRRKTSFTDRRLSELHGFLMQHS